MQINIQMQTNHSKIKKKTAKNVECIEYIFFKTHIFFYKLQIFVQLQIWTYVNMYIINIYSKMFNAF